AGTAPFGGLLTRRINRLHVHAVDFLAGNVERSAALPEMRFRARALHTRAHGVLVVLDHVDDRELPEFGHIEGLVDLALVRGAIAEIGERDSAVLEIAV